MRASQQGNSANLAAIKVVFGWGETYPELIVAETLGHHTNVIQIYEYGFIGSNVVLIMEWAAFGELADYLDYHQRHRTRIVTAIGKQLILDIVQGVEYVHLNGFIHGDLHAGNILLTSVSDYPGHHVIAKLSDFGKARAIDDNNYRKDFRNLCDLFYELITESKVKDETLDELERRVCVSRRS